MKGQEAEIEKAGEKATWFSGEKWLVITGVLGFVLALVCGIAALIYGTDVKPGSGLLRAASFNAALGIFLVSTAAIIPFSGIGRKGRTFFRWSYILSALYSYFAETVQHWRGVNPRFVEDGSTFDIVIGNLFGFVAMLLAVFYLVLTIQFFRQRAYRAYPEFVIGIRYAMIAVLLSFAGGFVIVANGGRFIGLEGNLIWMHGLGFHALQVLPFIAWLTLGSVLTKRIKHSLIHISGITFIGGLVAIGGQTLLGQPLIEWSLLPLTAIACFLVVTAAGARLLYDKLFGFSGTYAKDKKTNA
ncbi:hypothetical protein I6N90_19185 [Paenibacillus sp. GSMTC-2017]|nr:hypothetical protein [Paenibacillus sp. GSMTC-2017]